MKEVRCEQCTYYAKLETPFHYEKDGYPDGVTVWGFCAKDVKRSFGFYPVYVPDGGVCKEFMRKSTRNTSIDTVNGQITLLED